MKIFEVKYKTNEGEEIVQIGGRNEAEAIWLTKCQDIRFKKVKSISFLTRASKEEEFSCLSQINFYKDRK